jgi:anti-anti-sigma regulatory factor
VIFSLFGKREGRGAERRRSTAPDTVTARPAANTRGGVAARPGDPREIARLTAAKIDEIESEMIAPSPGAAGSRRPAGGVAGGDPNGLRPTTPAPASESSALRAVPPGGAPSVEVSGSAVPPAFEEAAVLYANGQATAAAMILWQSIKDDANAPHARQAWSMLFDLYQATARKEDFESLAIDYSARFESSPPMWDDALAPAAKSAPSGGSNASSVAMPAALDAQAIRQVEQVQRLAQRNRAVLLDVSPVNTVDPAGADLMLKLIAAFVRARRDLTVLGASSLLAVLERATATGRRDPSESVWLLRLEMLRILGMEQEFDDVSIDYCVTYEVSPPPWEPMPSTVRLAPVGDAESPTDRNGATPEAHAVLPDVFALSGEIEGRAPETFAALRGFAADRAEIVLDCRNLRRLDFTAAGEVLNELVSFRTGGKYLIFRDVNHLVGVLLSVMGVPDMAEIRIRRH